MSIALDATSLSGTKTGPGEDSWTHTVGSSIDDRIVVVAIQWDSTTTVLTELRIAGRLATKIRDDQGDVIISSALWYLVQPPRGVITISATFSGAQEWAAAGYSFSGVDVSAPIDANAGGNDTLNDPDVDITTVTDGAWVLDSVIITVNTLTVGSGQTQVMNQAHGSGFGAQVHASSYVGPIDPAALQNMTWAIGTPSAGRWASSVVALKPDPGHTDATGLASATGLATMGV